MIPFLLGSLTGQQTLKLLALTLRNVPLQRQNGKLESLKIKVGVEEWSFMIGRDKSKLGRLDHFISLATLR